MTPQTFPEFEAWLASQERSPRTISGYLADLALFSAWFERFTGHELAPVRLTPTDIRLAPSTA